MFRLCAIRRFTRLIVLLVFLPGLAHGVLVEDLYRIELKVADQSTATRLDAFNEAFRHLLIKISGSDESLQNPGLKRPLANSSRYVLQFRYQTRKEPAPNPDELPIDVLYLTVTFNRDLVESLLRENSVPLWGRERPSTLIVAHYREPTVAGVLVSGDTVVDLVDEFDEQARRKGLPILFPLLDLEDRATIGGAIDLLPDPARLDQLAQRYSPDVLLSGLVEMDGADVWQARWQAGFGDKLFNWSNRADSRELLLDQSLSELARLLASEYALKVGQVDDQDVLFRVEDVADVRDNIKVLNYLQSLDAVEDAMLIRVQGRQAVYRVRLRNSAEALHRLIALGYVLEQLELPQIDATQENRQVHLNYRLIR